MRKNTAFTRGRANYRIVGRGRGEREKLKAAALDNRQNYDKLVPNTLPSAYLVNKKGKDKEKLR